ncbi:hypothetical protein BAE30_06280 [Acidithiobacillus caldus]|uniref:Uncharacterized protein n=1 Tax=Acidithiobacillus caldus TaxID=33059 RepID=A0A1E7YX02_9PROT|nr:hypothetical protein BAE30_06280 [Acidithiobacillus caldus]
MKKAAPTTEAAQHNQPININTIRALRHMLAAIANLQTAPAVTQREQVLITETYLLLRSEVRRIAGRGGAE